MFFSGFICYLGVWFGFFLIQVNSTLTETCSHALGIQSGAIKDHQMSSINAYSDGISKYGPNNARLNKTSPPQGYRGDVRDPGSSWVVVNFERKIVLTGIATQGYGNSSVQEWVKSFVLFYLTNDGDDFKVLKTAKSNKATFSGNNDSNTIHRQNVAFPVIASEITLIPLKWNNNVGLRMELYGCKPDFSITVMLMLRGQPFTMNFLNNQSNVYKVAMDNSLIEAQGYWETVPGFLAIMFKGFSPQQSQTPKTLTAVEFEVTCLESKLQDILAKMKEFIKKSDVFDSHFYQLRYSRTNVCPPLSIKIMPTTTNDSRDISILKGSYLSLRIKITHNCTLKTNITKTCRLTSIDHITGSMSSFIPVILSSSLQITLNPKAYTYRKTRLIYLQCFAYINGLDGNFAQDSKFIRIFEGKVIAKITGSLHAIKGGNSIVLDGSKSYLQTKEFSSVIDMDFTWYCRMKTFSNKNTELLEGKSLNIGGCFNSSLDEPISRNKTLKIDASEIVGGGIYVFKLVVAVNGLSSSVKHHVTVEKFTNVSIVCISNCLRKINPKKKQVFRSECSGGACKKLKTYKWSFFLFDKKAKTYKERKMAENATSISQSGTIFTIKDFKQIMGRYSNEDEQFKIKVVGYLNSHAHVSKEEHFILNAVPNSSGRESGCVINPTEGTAMKTYFNISCENWKDDDIPLSYKFIYLCDLGMIILGSGKTSKINTKLLPGNKTLDFKLDIIITITDAFGASETNKIAVKVFLPPEQQANSIIHNTENKLNGLVKTGDTNEAADQSLFVLSLLDTFKKSSKTDSKTKDDILNKMSKVKVTSIAQVSRCGALASSATVQQTRLSQKTQNNALNIMESASKTMTSFLANKSTDLDLDFVEPVFGNLVKGVSNVLNSTLDNKNFTSKESGEAVAQTGAQTARRSTELIKEVANSLTSLLTTGDDAKVIRTSKVVIRVEKLMPSLFNKRIFKERHHVKIVLPPYKELFSNTIPTLLSCQMLEYPVNPFYWDASSKAVKSTVADIILQTDNKKINVHSLAVPVSLSLLQNKQASNPFEAKSTQLTTTKYFLKPPTNISDNMRYHKVFIPSPYVTLTVNLIPQEGSQIEVFIRRMKRPSSLLYNYTTKIPDLSTCVDKNVTTFKPENCSRNPFIMEVTSNTTGGTGLHFLGLRLFRLKQNESELVNASADRILKRSLPPWNSSHPYQKRDDQEKANTPLKSTNLDSVTKKITGKAHGLLKQHRREKRSCIEAKDPPPTTHSIFVKDDQAYDPKTDVTYNFSSSISACLFWSETEERWKSDGCKLGPKSNSTHIHCLCNHMTAFGGDFFVAPNPIDFDKVLFAFTNLGESKNYAVLSIVFMLWLLYIVGIVFARRADRNDKRKIVSCYINPLDETVDYGLKTYKISIQTASWIGSGTTASVGMTLYGDDIENLVSLYFNNTDPDKQLFARGSVNTFSVGLSAPLTDLFKITIWHDNSGSQPSWFLQDVIISEVNGTGKWYFLANRWLAVDKEDNCVSADIFLTEDKEVKKLRNRFYTRAAKQFTNAHLWLSVFTKSVHSPFTRCQRLSCCFLIFMATMVTNAMFYAFGAKSTDFILVGPFQVSLRGFKTGIQSSLIVVPLSVLLVLIFENVKQKQVMDEKDFTSVKVVKGFIPRPFLIIAWFLCLSGAITSSAFTIMYSLMWGTDIANQWLASIMVSLLQDILLTQPIKIIALVSLLSLIIKKPINIHDDIVMSKIEKLSSHEKVTVPTTEELKAARAFAANKTATKHTLKELGLYLPLIVLLLIVCYGNRDSQRFMITNSLQTIAPNFHQVTEPQSFWRWVKEEPIATLYDNTWYNNQTFKETDGFISNKKVFFVGMPRLRQLRVKDKLCSVKETAHLFKRCLSSYSISTEDRTPYSLPGWKDPHVENLTDDATKSKVEELCPRPWRYIDFKSIKTLPFYGSHILYGGGGFVADLGYNRSTAYNILDSLRRNNWIDDFTAAVFFEFTVFNPASSLFSSVRFLYERFPSGSMNTVMRIDTLTVYSPTNKSAHSFGQVCQLLLMVIIIVTAVAEIIKIMKQGYGYLKGIWNWVQWLQIISIVTAIAMFYQKEKYVKKFIARLKANPYETSSTDYIVMWSDLETFVLSFVIFIVTIKLLRLIRFSQSVYQLHHTIIQTIKKLKSWLLFYFVIMMALTFMAFIAFGNYSSNFSSFIKSFSKLIHLLNAGKVFQKDSSFSESPLGLIFVFLYSFLNMLFLVNILLSIIFESFAASKSNTDPKVLENAKQSDFMKKYFHTAFNSNKKKLTTFINKFSKGKLHKTKKRNEDKYVYHQIDSPEHIEFHEVDLKEKRCKEKKNRQKKLCERHYNNKCSEKLQFDSVFKEESECSIYDDTCLNEGKEIKEIINILRSITDEKM